MRKSRKCTGVWILSVVGIAVTMGLTQVSLYISECSAEEKKLTMNINREGTAGFACGTEIANVISKSSSLEISGIPYATPVAGARDAAEGKCDIPYLGAYGFHQMYNNEGPYEKNPVDKKPYQGFWYLDGDLFFLTKADRDDIKNLYDLRGKRIFPAKAGGAIYDAFIYVLRSLDIEIGKDVQMGYMDAASALKTGMIDAVGGYVLLSAKLKPGWIQNIDKQIKIKIIEPTPQAVSAIMEKVVGSGLGYEKWDIPFEETKGQTYFITQWYGWHFARQLPEEVVYEFMKTMTKPECGVQFQKGHKFLQALTNKEDFIRAQKAGINSIPKIPIHPGAARLYKEIGLWQNNWTIGKVQ